MVPNIITFESVLGFIATITLYIFGMVTGHMDVPDTTIASIPIFEVLRNILQVLAFLSTIAAGVLTSYKVIKSLKPKKKG